MIELICSRMGKRGGIL